MPAPKNIQTIFIGNVLESYYASYDKLSESEKKYWTEYDALENGRSLLYDGDNKALITPVQINPQHMEHLKSLVGWKNVINLFPANYSNSICEDILADPRLHENFINLVKENPGVNIIPYRHTKEFYTFINELKKLGLKFELPETALEENIFIERYFHSKRGFRHLWEMVIDKSPDANIGIPFGFITENKTEAKSAAYWFKKKKKNFVLKYSRGVQGIGVMLFDQSEFSDNFEEFSKQIEAKLTADIWNEACIDVAELIDVDPTVLGGSPNVEMRILQDGKVIHEYPCEQVLDADHKTFLGVGMNKELLSSPYIEAAFKAAEKYGQKLSELGYRGYFDMDLVVSKGHKVFAVESNLRRTGGTHINDFAKSLLGADYIKNFYVFSYEIKLDPKTTYTYDEVAFALQNILYNPKTKSGVVIVNADLIKRNVLPLMIIAHSRAEQVKIKEAVQKNLDTNSPALF